MHSLIQIVARILAWFVNVGIFPISLFRRIHFKGKLTIAGYLHAESFPPNGVYESRGLLYDVDFSDSVQRHIYLNLFEREETTMLPRLVKAGNICMDVGANVGYYTLTLAHLIGPTGRVHAFEPDKKNQAKLLRNIELNKFQDRIIVNQKAVSSQTGTARFELSADVDSGWGHIATDTSTATATQQTVEVETVTLDDYFRSTGIERVHFFKCDIESHEFEMLAGARETLEKQRIDQILIEYNGFHLNPAGRSVREYVELFERYHYRAVEMNLDRIEKAKAGVVAKDIDTYNLVFTRLSDS